MPPHWYNLVRKFYMEVETLKITLNLDTNEIIVPKNFFKNLEKQNAIITKMGGEKIDSSDLIRASVEVALSDTEKYLHVKE